MKDLTKGNIYKTFLLFALPMVLSALLSQAYHVIDTVVAGQYLGDEGLAAIGATSSLITFVTSVFWGYGSGFAIYIARLFGAKEYSAIKRVLCNNYLFMSLAALLICAVLFAFRFPIYHLLRVPDSIWLDTDIYFSICIWGTVFTMLSANGVYIMNAFGSGTFPFIVSLASSVVNIAGNLLLVRPLGIAGLAWATVASAAVAVVCYVIRVCKNFREMGVAHERVRIDPSCLYITFRYAVPCMFQQSVMYLSSLVLSPFVNGISAAATASYTVAKQVYDVNSAIYQNSAKTLSNFVAQCLGAGKEKKIRKGLTVAFMQGILFLLPVLLLCVLLPKATCSLFFSKDASPEAVQYSVNFLRFVLPFILFNVLANLFHAFFRGYAKMWPLFLATCIGSAVRIVFSILLAEFFGIYGIFAGWALSWLADGLFGIGLYWFKYRKGLKEI